MREKLVAVGPDASPLPPLAGTLAAVATQVAAEAQQAGKMCRIRLLETTSAAQNARNVDALCRGLR